MPGRQQCEFFLLRYVPDALKDEFVNVGVVLYTTEAEGKSFADVQFTSDWKRVRCLDPEVEVDVFTEMEREIRQALRDGGTGREWLMKRMEDTFSNAIQLTPAKAVLTESPQAEIGVLSNLYLERPRRGGRTISGRQAIFRAMRGEFERQGVWQFLRQSIPVADYTHRGDPLKIDCSYRPNGTVKMFHAVSPEGDVNLAKVLAFGYPKIREGVRQRENAEVQLTAIIESELDRDDSGIGFAMHVMREHEIRVSTVADLPRIAERAREELKL